MGVNINIDYTCYHHYIITYRASLLKLSSKVNDTTHVLSMHVVGTPVLSCVGTYALLFRCLPLVIPDVGTYRAVSNVYYLY